VVISPSRQRFEAEKENKETLIHRLLAPPLCARKERRLEDGTRMMSVHRIECHLKEQKHIICNRAGVSCKQVARRGPRNSTLPADNHASPPSSIPSITQSIHFLPSCLFFCFSFIHLAFWSACFF
jgi:hypothetical protein